MWQKDNPLHLTPLLPLGLSPTPLLSLQGLMPPPTSGGGGGRDTSVYTEKPHFKPEQTPLCVGPGLRLPLTGLKEDKQTQTPREECFQKETENKIGAKQWRERERQTDRQTETDESRGDTTLDRGQILSISVAN